MSLKEQLITALLKDELLTQEQVNQVLQAHKQKGGKLKDILIGMQLISEKALLGVLSREAQIPCVTLSRYQIDPQVSQLIDQKTAQKYQIVPLSLIGKNLTVAISDPLDLMVMDDIKTLSGCEILPVLATTQEIQETIDRCYGPQTQQIINEIVENLSSEKMEWVFKKEMAEVEEDVSKDAPIVTRMTHAILEQGIKLRASDVLIEPLEKNLRVRYRVDGILREAPAPPKHLQNAIVSRIKVMSSLDIAEKRLPQDGRFRIRFVGRDVDMRVSVLPTVLGEKVVLRVLDKNQFTLDLNKLGYDSLSLERLKKAALRPHGMILVTGPTGSGKTTTLYSLVKHADSPTKNIVTVEDPVEYEMFGVNQVQVRPEIDLTFASALRSILRQDPNVVLLGEIRDSETADVAINAALTGHLVLSTLHTNTAAGAVVRLVNMGIEPFLISSSIILIAAQRLVRKICGRCKESYQVPQAILDRLGSTLEADVKNLTFYRGKGCQYCNKTGYLGRIGIIEVLSVSQRIRELINQRKQEHELKQTAREEGMQTLRENGLQNVNAGFTTIEEVLRVTVGDQV